jgi:hypothetical protein
LGENGDDRTRTRKVDRPSLGDCRRSGREGPGANGEVPSGRTQSTRSAWRQSGRRAPDRRRGGTLRYGHDSISVRIQLDDDRVSEEQAALRLIEAGASRLGPTEDYEILHGAHPAEGAPPEPEGGSREPRNSELQGGRIGLAQAGRRGAGTTPILANDPTATRIITAITTAIANLIRNSGSSRTIWSSAR